MTKHLRVEALDVFWQATRAAHGVRLADSRGALARARAVLGRGGAVAMMIDQVPERAQHAVAGNKSFGSGHARDDIWCGERCRRVAERFEAKPGKLAAPEIAVASHRSLGFDLCRIAVGLK